MKFYLESTGHCLTGRVLALLVHEVADEPDVVGVGGVEHLAEVLLLVAAVVEGQDVTVI